MRTTETATLEYAWRITILALHPETEDEIKRRLDREEIETLLKEYNTAGRIEGLTESEGLYLLKYNSLDALRDRFDDEGISPRFKIYEGQV